MQFEEQTTQSLIGVLGGDLLEGQQTFTVFGENVNGYRYIPTHKVKNGKRHKL